MANDAGCLNCRYWHPAWKFKREQSYQSESTDLDMSNPRRTEGLRRRSRKGLCRRYAPQASSLTIGWMETKPNDWCGDYEPMTEASDLPS